MIFNIITLFPEFFDSPCRSGLLGKALEKGILELNLVNIRDYAEGNYRRCDDYPFGGGCGMVLMAPPVMKALESLKGNTGKVVMTSPGGILLNQRMVKELSGNREITVICGHYEGIDQRVVDRCVDYEISIGDYVLSGGEYAALVIMDSIARYIPGFMTNRESLAHESFEDDLLEYPQYTRPAELEGEAVPEVLVNGNHGEIERWRLHESIEKTKKVRPDLYKRYLLKKIKGDEHNGHHA